MSKKTKGYLSGAGGLAFAVVLAKVLGAVYRIPLANMIGSEGMGLYQFVYPVFALLLTLSSGAVPTAVSISVSEFTARGEEEECKKFFSSAIAVAAMIGLVGSVLLIAVAYPVSFIQSRDAFLGYLAISPAVFIVTLVSCFRGYFTGKNNLFPSSLSQITEGIVKLGVGLTLTHFLLPYGVPYAVVGALLGVVSSEFVTLLIMAVIFFAQGNRLAFVPLSGQKENGKKMLRRMFPLVICGMILPVAQFVDSVLIVNLLRLFGVENATSLYGVWSGIVIPLINLPVMVCISLGVAITPQMAEGRERGDVGIILQKSSTSIKLTFFLGIPFVILYLLIPEKILGLLYSGIDAEKIALAALLLRISAVGVLGLSVFQIYSAMLQGLGRSKTPVKIIAVSMIVKLLLTTALTPSMGLVGVAVAALIGYVLAGVWIFVYFALFTRLEKTVVKNVSLILLCGVIMGSTLLITTRLQTGILPVALIGIGAGVVYFISVLLLGVFSTEEWKAMPLSSFFVKLDKRINGE